MQTANDHNLYTVAHLSVQFQVPYRTMQTALDVISAEPDLALNVVPYYMLNDERIELIREYLDTRRHNNELNKGAAWTADLPTPEGFRPATQ